MQTRERARFRSGYLGQQSQRRDKQRLGKTGDRGTRHFPMRLVQPNGITRQAENRSNWDKLYLGGL